MTVYAKDNFIKSQNGRINTVVLKEAASPGTILNRADHTVQDATDRMLEILINEVEFGTDFGTDITLYDRVFTSPVGEPNHVFVKGTGTIAEGATLIADQTHLGFASASTTADDIANYKIGKALKAKDSNNNVLTDLGA